MDKALQNLIRMQQLSTEQQWIRPAYHGQCIVNVMNSLLEYFGVEHGTTLSFHDEFIASLAGKRKILFFLIDGLGWCNLEFVAEQSSLVHDWFSTITRWPITTVSPSTTSTASASYLTALPPAGHGVLGFLMYFPEYHRIFNMLGFRSPDRLHEDLMTLGFMPERYLACPTVLDLLERAGVFVGAYNAIQYAGSGLSRLIYTRHLPYPYVALGDMLEQALQQLEISAPQFQFMYWSTPDTLAHLYGAHSYAYINEVAMLSLVIRQQLLPRLDGDTALVICADHGHIDGDDSEALNLAEIPGMMDLFRVPPAGEGRETQLFIRPGYLDRARELLDSIDHMLVMTQDAFIASGLLGETPLRPEIRERIGDLVVFPHGSRRTLYPYEARPHTAMVGRHGGLSPEEMIVPLMVVA